MLKNQNTTSPEYEALKRNKEKQRQAKDILLTEKLQVQKAREEKEPNHFGKKEKPVTPFQLSDFLWKCCPYVFGLLTLFAIFVGFRLRKFEYFTAEEGTGYALGIIGGSMMLALLLYPLRKRFRIFRLIGNVRVWFAIHMILGVLGPVLILYHSNFSLGSTNSNVALFSMLIVSASGVIGRYIYTKIHHGLYGKKIEVAQLKERLQSDQQELTALLQLYPEVKKELFSFVEHFLTPTKGLFHSWERVMSAGIRSRLLIRKIKKLVRANNKDQSRKEVRTKVKVIVRESSYFLHHTRKLIEFGFYERMFALWHVLHLPLFFMLVIAAIVHVAAVHWY